MKNSILLLVAMFIATSAFSQKKQDVVYLKNGSVIKGEIIYLVPEKDLVIKTSDGQLYNFSFNEIEQIEQPQEINLDEYGGKASYGIAIGGFGIAGVPIRMFSSNKFAFEIAPFYSIATVKETTYFKTTTKIISYFQLTGGPNFYFQRFYKERKEKVKLNGISIKAGCGIAGLTSYSFSCAWIHESFRLNKLDRSFTFELGPGISEIRSSYQKPVVSIGIYTKIQWNLFY